MLDFNISQECVIGHRTDTILSPADFEIDIILKENLILMTNL